MLRLWKHRFALKKFVFTWLSTNRQRSGNQARKGKKASKSPKSKVQAESWWLTGRQIKWLNRSVRNRMMSSRDEFWNGLTDTKQ